MAVRDSAKAERVRAGLTGDIDIRPLDLADLDSVRRFADGLRADGQELDVLINNAGTGSQQRLLTPQGYELVFATNHLGPFALTGLLMDRFRLDHDPRIVTVGSNLYRRRTPRTDFDDLTAAASFSPGATYLKSKTANLLFSSELDRRLTQAESPIRSFLVHPGMTSTPMHEQAHGLLQKALLAAGKALLSRPADEGALPLVYAAGAPDAPTGKLIGYSIRRRDKRLDADDLVAPVTNTELAATLWHISEQATGVTYLGDAALPDTDTDALRPASRGR